MHVLVCVLLVLRRCVCSVSWSETERGSTDRVLFASALQLQSRWVDAVGAVRNGQPSPYNPVGSILRKIKLELFGECPEILKLAQQVLVHARILVITQIAEALRDRQVSALSVLKVANAACENFMRAEAVRLIDLLGNPDRAAALIPQEKVRSCLFTPEVVTFFAYAGYTLVEELQQIVKRALEAPSADTAAVSESLATFQTFFHSALNNGKSRYATFVSIQNDHSPVTRSFEPLTDSDCLSANYFLIIWLEEKFANGFSYASDFDASLSSAIGHVQSEQSAWILRCYTTLKARNLLLCSFLLGRAQALEGEPVCVICLEPIILGCKLDCGHLFHSACLQQWITESSSACPVCRSSLSGIWTKIAKEQDCIIAAHLTPLVILECVLFVHAIFNIENRKRHPTGCSIWRTTLFVNTCMQIASDYFVDRVKRLLQRYAFLSGDLGLERSFICSQTQERLLNISVEYDKHRFTPQRISSMISDGFFESTAWRVLFRDTLLSDVVLSQLVKDTDALYGR